MAPTSNIQPKPEIVLFASGVLAILETWQALKLAISESWGGPDGLGKRKWMASEIVDAFESPPIDGIPDDQYIEEMLLQIMSDEFDTVLEDGSAERVGKDIVKLWNDIHIKKIGEGEVARLEGLANKQRGMKVEAEVQVISDEEIEGSGEGEWTDEEDDEPPKLIDNQTRESKQPQVDEDGFTLVNRKGKH